MTPLTRAEVERIRKGNSGYRVTEGQMLALADTALALMDERDLLHKANVTLNGLYDQADAECETAEAALRTAEAQHASTLKLVSAYRSRANAAEARCRRLEGALRDWSEHHDTCGPRCEALARARALLSEPQDGEGGTPEKKSDIICGDPNCPFRVSERDLERGCPPTSPPASPCICDPTSGTVCVLHAPVVPEDCGDPYCRIHPPVSSDDGETCPTCGGAGVVRPTSPPASPACICPVFRDVGGVERTGLADLTCPVHGVATSPPAEPTREETT